MRRLLGLYCLFLLAAGGAAMARNLVADPSFEKPKPKDQFGFVFQDWGGWKYEGECEFQVSDIAHSGQHSLVMVGGNGPKIRMRPNALKLAPGRYRVTAYLRGLDISTGQWNGTTEFMFNDTYMGLKKNGTFGWTKFTYVGEVKQTGDNSTFSFGLWAPGRFWIDDVSVEKVGSDVALTAEPVLGQEEAPIVPPGEFGPGEVRCPDCGYRNMPQWEKCYACGATLAMKKAASVPPVKLIAGFEDKNPFAGGTVVTEHATEGTHAIRVENTADSHWISLDTPPPGPQEDWTGYDYLKLDLYTEAKDPVSFFVELRDTATDGYWTRVNYITVIPPGASTLIVPVKTLYVGEKSRPGRMLILNGITRFVVGTYEKPEAPVYVDNVRLEVDREPQKVQFDGLWAFDFGSGSSPLMEGFTPLTPATLYSKGRGYGLKEARIWRGAVDVLQPDPLYQDFICIEAGGLAVDVPNGRYRVFVNMDNPSGFWGEYQAYTKRAILAEGVPVVTETTEADSFTRKYFRFWNSDDSPLENTFDKYQKAYFKEKIFDVEVKDGQLNIDFQGSDYACSVAAVIIFPLEKAAEGARFLKYTEDRRRFHFDNYFKRVLHRPTGDPLQPTQKDTERGYVVFARDYAKDVYYNDTPLKGEIGAPITAGAFAGEQEPMTVGVVPLKDLGAVTVTASDLAGPKAKIPASAISVGYVSYRVTRVTAEGSVYTISPRIIMPTNSVAMPKGVVRRFWLTVKVPDTAKPGLYKGSVTIAAERGGVTQVPVQLRVRKGTLEAVDVPAGPFSYTIDLPWPGPEAAKWNEAMARKSLAKLRECGFTSFSGMPIVNYQGFKDGKPVFDFTIADAQMKLAREMGFTKALVSYTAFYNLNLYQKDTGAMQAAGFTDYSQFLRAVFTAIQRHAQEANWLPVYWGLGDEPSDDASVAASTENALAYRKAFPQGPPYTTLFTSFTGDDEKSPHVKLAEALHAPALNGHDEAAVNLLHKRGDAWGFYNNGSRWTFGVYMFKAAQQFGMKFRTCWHWNASAGDPYYALDCREDDYAWCTATPDGRLMETIYFDQLRAGLGDYRRLLTLQNLVKAKPTSPAGKAGQKVLDTYMAAFKLGQTDASEKTLPGGWNTMRQRVDDAIEALRK